MFLRFFLHLTELIDKHMNILLWVLSLITSLEATYISHFSHGRIYGFLQGEITVKYALLIIFQLLAFLSILRFVLFYRFKR